MRWTQTKLRLLREELAKLYGRMSESGRVVMDAGLDPTHISLDPKAIQNWFHILEYARCVNNRQGVRGVDAIFAVVAGEFSARMAEVRILLDAEEAPALALAIGARELVEQLEAVAPVLEVDLDTLRQAYSLSASPRWRRPDFNAEPRKALTEAIRLLGEATVKEGEELPLVRFVRAIREGCSPEQKRALDHCEAICGATPPVSPPPPVPPVASKMTDELMIEIDPGTLPGSKISLRAWLFRGGSITELYHQTLDGLEGVYAEVGAIRQKAYGDGCDDFGVEVLLPDELLDRAVDEWPVEIEGLGEDLIGKLHPVVIRSLSRAKRPEFMAYLRKKWSRCRATLEAQCCAQIASYDPARQPDLTVWFELDRWDKMLVFQKVRDANLMVALLDQPPRGGSAPSSFNALLAAGVPIILWARSTDRSAAEAALKLLVENKPLEALRHRLYSHRSGETTSLAAPVTLLWEDPERPRPGAQHRLAAAQPRIQEGGRS